MLESFYTVVHIRINKRLVFVHPIEYGFKLHPDSFLLDCFLVKTINKSENGSGCFIHLQYYLGLQQRRFFPLAFISHGQWEGTGSHRDINQHRAQGSPRNMTPSEATGMVLAAWSRSGRTKTTFRLREA
jgi:hypothetical protein